MVQFLEVLFFPFVLAVVYVLPFLGVVFSEKNSKRWMGHWLVTILVVNVISVMTTWFLKAWMIQFFQITIAVALLLTFTNDKTDQIFGIVDSGVQVAKAQIDEIKNKVYGSLRQQRLAQ